MCRLRLRMLCVALSKRHSFATRDYRASRDSTVCECEKPCQPCQDKRSTDDKRVGGLKWAVCRPTVITVSLIANLLHYKPRRSDLPAVFEIFIYDHHQRSLVKTERAQSGLDLSKNTLFAQAKKIRNRFSSMLR